MRGFKVFERTILSFAIDEETSYSAREFSHHEIFSGGHLMTCRWVLVLLVTSSLAACTFHDDIVTKP